MKNYFLFILFCCCIACKQTNKISPQNLTNILLDMHLADAKAGIIYRTDTNRKQNIFSKNTDSLQQYYANIFAKYNTNETDFVQTMHWYNVHPIELDSIYNKVLANIISLQIKKDSVTKK